MLNKISQLAGELPRADCLPYTQLTFLPGAINRHKNGQVQGQQEQPQRSYGGMRSHSPTNRNADPIEGYPPASTGWRGAGRGRGGFRGHRGFHRGGRPNHVHRNKSLVLNASNPAAPSTGENDNLSTSAATSTWVSKTNPGHRQLINPAIFEKEKDTRIKNMEELRLQKLKKKDQHERARLERHIKAEMTRQVIVDGGIFRVSKKGQKLQRISGERQFARKRPQKPDLVNQSNLPFLGAPTPKTGFVAGVKFYRSKNGNMYRDASIKIHGYGDLSVEDLTTYHDSTDTSNTRKAKKTVKPCKAFTITGIPFLFKVSISAPP